MEKMIIIIGIVGLYAGALLKLFYFFSASIINWRFLKKLKEQGDETKEPEKPDYVSELLPVYDDTLEPQKDENGGLTGIKIVTKQLFRYETRYEHWAAVSWHHLMRCGALCCVGGSIGFFEYKFLWFLALIMCFQVPVIFSLVTHFIFSICLMVVSMILLGMKRFFYWLISMFNKKQEA